ncbi:MAG: flagellar basal-body rod protein FlgF [Alphaproteobacteria bacterium]|nr:flagellar basal-body rod protein FlgF [Alphaproteobacteria bacterium]
MENPIFIGLSRQMALRSNMDVVANNIANMNTPGFRAQNMVFTEYLSDPRGADDAISMVVDAGQFQVTKAGPVHVTGNPLDVALAGPGYFGVQTPDGIQYTRAGNFELNINRELVTPAGNPVVNEGGAPIVIPEDAGQVKISESGFLAGQNGEIGKLMIVEFENVQMLEPRGNNLYWSPDPGQPATQTRAQQGAIEGSNVNAILEVSKMIEVSRDYQSIQRMLQNEHDRQRGAIQKLSGGNR